MTEPIHHADENLETGAQGLPSLPEGEWRWQRVCDGQALVDGGDGVRFEVPGPAGRQQAFVVRFDGQVRAYLNQCRHIPVELDWQPGRFFDISGLYLVCATHGAAYDPEDGACVAGPCQGQRLHVLQAAEIREQVWVAVRSDY